MPQPYVLTLDSPPEQVEGLRPGTLRMLQKEGIDRIGELVLHFPVRHEDRRQLNFTAFSPSDTPVCHRVRILKTRVLGFGGRGGVFEAVVEGASGNPMNQQLTLRWFKMTFLQKVLAVDMELMIYGRIKEIKARLVMDHPDYEIVTGTGEDDEHGLHTSRIVPVYRLRGALKQKPFRSAIWEVLEQLEDSALPDLLPLPRAGGEFAGLSRARALRQLHHPEEFAELEQARRYLALEEFYLMQLRAVRRRHQFKQNSGWSHVPHGSLLRSFLDGLPFQLTQAQERSLDEILADLALPQPMNRLLHGDVGSGKTVVALAAMLVVVESGHQASLMAPTQILAEQHYQNALRWLVPLGVRVALRTGDKVIDGDAGLFGCGRRDDGLSQDESPSTREGRAPLASSGPDVIIGTHALLYDQKKSNLSRLGLVVIDEQHKFGVAQRARLVAQGVMPDVLVMTATPIPRTLTLTLYGDLDVSTIDQRPKERGRIITAVREITKVDEVTQFVLTRLEEGRQCYVVYPLIDESEKLDLGAATTGHGEWSKRLAPHATGLLHGRMDAEEKESVMRRFRDGEIQVLVSTTVIEVGVDVPNATLMIIHDAARFGLAQLHQLRGRIGRGSHTSYAVLFVPKGDKEALERLQLLAETSDGFKIAEEDLRRRGPGDVLGSAQSGQSPLRFGTLLADTRLVTMARKLADRTLAADPLLAAPEHARLRTLVGDEVFEGGTMQ